MKILQSLFFGWLCLLFSSASSFAETPLDLPVGARGVWVYIPLMIYKLLFGAH
jgi:hypothetical protein